MALLSLLCNIINTRRDMQDLDQSAVINRDPSAIHYTAPTKKQVTVGIHYAAISLD